ncbi:AMP-binding protein [Streptomyces sp. NPDC048595]|uniref:AMP-binding protein n=1 Tax=Streptomyces sp. NPDC048595 TaxID=3365576 RepID=UPI0037124137
MSTGRTSTRRTLYDWFAVSAAARPDATALEVDGQALDYAGLTTAADRLAAGLLRHLNGRVPSRVGLLASRSVVAYAGYLAVQRLGATVVPLGTAFPAHRNAAVAEAAALDAVLTDGSGDPTGIAAPVWWPEQRSADATATRCGAPARDGAELPPMAADPDGIAYILFTSGSTGRPKGVPVRHHNVTAYLEHVVPRAEAGPGARLSQTFDLTFDPSVFDMFVAWGSGAALVVPTRDEVLAPVRFIRQRGITHWNSVPSVITLAGRLRALKPESMPTLRHSMFCGEPLTYQQARAWRRAAPGSTLDNGYGPTELTVTCATYRLPESEDDWPRTANGTVPIGTPHPGADILLHEGELCVRGPQRFHGYLDAKDDEGRFLTPDAAPRAPGAALTAAYWYRTGDRVTRHASGELVHLGRLDQQVQLHGYRVELGEVEAVLRQLPGVADAVVLARPTAHGPQLAAAYSGTGHEVPDAERVGAALRERLPGYMVPETLTALAALPLNPNGKIDRAAVDAILARGRAG